MTRIDLLSDPSAALAALADRVRALETANPLAHASLSSGLLRILVDGAPVAAIGHASNRAGFLIASGGGYVRVQEWVDERIAGALAGVQEDLDWLGQQIASLGQGLSGVDGRLGTAESGLNWLSSRSQIHDSQIGGLSGRMAAAEGGISSLAGSRDAQANAISAIITNLVAIINRLNEQSQWWQEAGKPYRPPLVQG